MTLSGFINLRLRVQNCKNFLFHHAYARRFINTRQCAYDMGRKHQETHKKVFYADNPCHRPGHQGRFSLQIKLSNVLGNQLH